MSQTRDRPSLLVVDDDPVVARLVHRQLEVAGFRPSVAGTGAQARARLAAESFDLVLLDVGLPDEDGIDLCRDLKAQPQLRDLPVIFMTARGAEPDILRGFDAGGVDYVVKPFEPRVLIARVTTHTTLSRLSRGLQCALDARTASLRAAHRRMRELDAQMRLAGERERRRLADQLHDSTIQQLVLARVLLERPASAPDPAERLRDLIDLSLSQLRTLVFELSPPVLYRAGLFPALEWLAGQLAQQWSVPFDCRLDGVPFPVTDDIKVTLFQGARELMTNVGKHARARACRVLLAFEPRTLCLSVSDDGIGLDPELLRDPSPERPGPAGSAARGVAMQSGGFGLFSLRSRIELLGGDLRLGPGDAGGTVATLRVPVS